MLFYHLSTAFFAVAFATAAPTRLENPKLLKLPYGLRRDAAARLSRGFRRRVARGGGSSSSSCCGSVSKFCIYAYVVRPDGVSSLGPPSAFPRPRPSVLTRP